MAYGRRCHRAETSICRPDGARSAVNGDRRTSPSGVRPTGTERAARPSSTRSGCESEIRIELPFARRWVALNENVLVVRADMREIIPPSSCGVAVPISALASSHHLPTSNPVSIPANTASAESLPKAPAAAVPSRVSCSASQPARKPNGTSNGRHDSEAPDAGAMPAKPYEVNAVAAMPLCPFRVSVVASWASTK